MFLEVNIINVVFFGEDLVWLFLIIRFLRFCIIFVFIVIMYGIIVLNMEVCVFEVMMMMVFVLRILFFNVLVG